MTNSELAEWFGISEKTFRNQKEKKINEFKNYAIFELDKGKIIVKKILVDEYVKKNEKIYEKVKNKFEEVWDESGLDTCSNVRDGICEVMDDEELNPNTAYLYTVKARNELYGKPYKFSGSIGSCYYKWCKWNEEEHRYVALSEDEERIKRDLQTKYFGDATEKQIFIKAKVMAGELSAEEAWYELEEITNMNNNFFSFLKELKEKLGCQVIKGTQLEKGKFIEKKNLD